MHTPQRHRLTATLVLSALFTLAACDNTPEPSPPATSTEAPSVGARVDGVVDRTQEVIGDAGITAKVKSKFIADSELKALQIDVDTTNGAVTLRGSVATPMERDRAATVARETEGVTSVDNQLIVRS